MSRKEIPSVPYIYFNVMVVNKPLQDNSHFTLYVCWPALITALKALKQGKAMYEIGEVLQETSFFWKHWFNIYAHIYRYIFYTT